MNIVVKEKSLSGENGRIDFIDIQKGIGILLVVFGHLISADSYIYRIVFSFHMPLFFLLSGYCYTESLANWGGRKIWGKFCKLLIPSWIYVNLFFAIQLGFSQYWGIVKENPLAYIVPENEWFLPTIFSSTMLLVGFTKLQRKKLGGSEKLVFSVLSVFLAIYFGVTISDCSLVVWIHQRVFFRIDHMLIAFSFQLIGYMWRNYSGRIEIEKMSVRIKIYVALAGLIVLIYTYKNSYVNLCDGKYGNSLFMFYWIALFWNVILSAISRKINSCKRIAGILKFWGRNSLWIYIGQGLLIASEYIILGKWYNSVAVKLGFMTWESLDALPVPYLCAIYTLYLL